MSHINTFTNTDETNETFNLKIKQLQNLLIETINCAPKSNKNILETINWMLNKIDINIDVSYKLYNEKIIKYNKICDDISQELNNYGITQDHLEELQKIKGCITGSFVFKHIIKNLHGVVFMENDIDIIIPVNDSMKNNFGYYVVSLINKIKKDLSLECIKKETSYNLVDNLLETQMLTSKDKKINLNILYVSCDTSTFINSFDLGCCKNLYNLNDFVSVEYDLIKEFKSTVRYNKISLDKIHKGNSLYLNKSLCRLNKDSLTLTPLYVHYCVLFDIYVKNPVKQYKCYNNGVHGIVDIFSCFENNYACITDLGSNREAIVNNYNINMAYNNKINKYFPIISHMEILENKLINNSIELLQEEVDIMNMIRCYGRIKKYKCRGIKNFECIC